MLIFLGNGKPKEWKRFRALTSTAWKSGFQCQETGNHSRNSDLGSCGGKNVGKQENAKSDCKAVSCKSVQIWDVNETPELFGNWSGNVHTTSPPETKAVILYFRVRVREAMRRTGGRRKCNETYRAMMRQIVEPRKEQSHLMRGLKAKLSMLTLSSMAAPLQSSPLMFHASVAVIFQVAKILFNARAGFHFEFKPETN